MVLLTWHLRLCFCVWLSNLVARGLGWFSGGFGFDYEFVLCVCVAVGLHGAIRLLGCVLFNFGLIC